MARYELRCFREEIRNGKRETKFIKDFTLLADNTTRARYRATQIVNEWWRYSSIIFFSGKWSVLACPGPPDEGSLRYFGVKGYDRLAYRLELIKKERI